jgi:hypothetical protein
MRDELLAAIEAGDEAGCVGLLRGLDETARRALYPAVAQALAEAEGYRRATTARLAMLGTATLSELKKAGSWVWPAAPAQAILAERRPAWLAQWAEFQLEKNVRNWPLMRALVRDGLTGKPATEFYILGMIAAPNRNRPPRELLARDRGLLDDELWRLFECEGSGELSLAAYDKYVQDQHTWLEAFRAMAADGTVDRARVLGCTLDALARDFAPFRAGWFSRLHEALEPTRDERVALRERYLDLLRSRVPATVSFAMKALVDVDRAGALDTMAALDRLAPAVEARDKGTAIRALAILGKAAQPADSGEAKARIAAVAALGLGHQSADVQALALNLVGDRSELLNPYLQVMAPSVRAKLETVAAEPAGIEPQPAGEGERVSPVRDVGELTELFAAVLENQGPPADIERVIDGVARMTAPERLTAMLAKRAAKLLERSPRQQPRAALAELALAWTQGRRTPEPVGEANLADFLVWRVWCAAEQAAQRVERPLLSLPTWADGRIDPPELARRLDALPSGESEAEPLFRLDLLQAQLRAGTKRDRGWPAAQLTWKVQRWEASGKTYSHHYAILEVAGPVTPGRFDPAWLSTARLHASLEMKRWCATVCPIWREGWFGAGCQELGTNIDWWEANWSTRAYLEPLALRNTEIGPMGALLIALGLGAREAGESMLAVDALTAALAEGRLDHEGLGRSLVEAASSGAIQYSRWSKQLARAAQAGSAQAKAIFLAIEALFESGHGKNASDYWKLVELERELAHLTGLRLSRPGAAASLETVSTGGKTKRVIAELLAL